MSDKDQKLNDEQIKKNTILSDRVKMRIGNLIFNNEELSLELEIALKKNEQLELAIVELKQK